MKNILLTLVVLSGGSAFAESHKIDCKDEANYPEISYSELKDVVAKKGATVFDVNSKDSFAKIHVPTAMHFGTVEGKFASKLPKDKNALVIAYCGGPQCTAWKKAAERACSMGYTNVKHFKDGISGWEKESKSGA